MKFYIESATCNEAGEVEIRSDMVAYMERVGYPVTIEDRGGGIQGAVIELKDLEDLIKLAASLEPQLLVQPPDPDGDGGAYPIIEVQDSIY